MASQADVAAHLDLTQPAVSQMLAAGVLPAGSGRAALDLDACRVAYVRHLREVAAGRASAAGGDGLDLVLERARLAKEQADAQAMRNDLTRGEVVRVEDVAREVGEEYARVRTRLLAIPSNVAPALARLHKPHEVLAVLSDRINEALAELSGVRQS